MSLVCELYLSVVLDSVPLISLPLKLAGRRKTQVSTVAKEVFCSGLAVRSSILVACTVLNGVKIAEMLYLLCNMNLSSETVTAMLCLAKYRFIFSRFASSQ